jgi:hypothetical protein
MDISYNTLKSYKIPYVDLSDHSCNKPGVLFNLDIYNGLEKELNDVKNLQDEYFENKHFLKFHNKYDVFKEEKMHLKKTYNAQNPTNAWIKCYEMISYYKLVNKKNKNFVYFDNAAFPGSFILATNHYVNTQTDIKNFEWYASSWVQPGTEILEDSYDLYKNYPEHWLMNEEYDGDVRNMKNQENWERILNNNVDLYTSDLGLESKDDYSKQEQICLHANVSQILTGILTLKKGGNMITKQYTYFEPLNITMYAILTNLFEEVYICKPSSSRPFNSETYIIGKNFQGPFKETEYQTDLIELIKDKVENFNKMPLIYKKCLTKEYMEKIKETLQIFYDQILYINDKLAWYVYISSTRDYKEQLMKSNEYIGERKDFIISEWRKYPMKKINKDKNLKVRDIYHYVNKNNRNNRNNKNGKQYK